MAGWTGAALAAGIVTVDLMVLWPGGASGTGYLLSLSAGVGSDGLIVGLLALVLLRPVGLRSADRSLVLGGLVFALAVAYRVGINLMARLAAPGEPTFALPSGPFVDPLIASGLRGLGACLLAAGVAQLARAGPRSWGMWSGLQIAAAVGGICVAGLILAAAAFVATITQGRAEIAWAVEVLGWTALAVVALCVPWSRARRPLALGAGLLLASSAVAVIDLLVREWWWGPVRAWFPALLDWHDAYIYVAVLDFLGWAALWLGFLALATPAARSARFWTGKDRNEQPPHGGEDASTHARGW